MHTRLCTRTVVGLVISGLASAAHGQLLGSGFTSGSIYDINKTTAATSNARSTGQSYVDIANSPSGMLYGVTVSVSPGTALYQIDPSTGASTFVGSTGLPSFIEGDLAFSPTGTLYGFDVGTEHLVSIDTATGAGTTIGTALQVDDISTLFFSGGNLYALDDKVNTGGNAVLYRLNPTTGAVVSSVTTNVDFAGALGGGEAEPGTGIVYVAANGTTLGSLYTLNVTTGAFTLVGTSPGLSDVSGITFVSVPEPATLVALSGLGSVALRRRRR